MIPQRRRMRGRWAAALALFAILLQSLLPALHHPAGMALAGAVGLDDRGSLCAAAGAGGPADHRPKAPTHPMPGCAICQAVHAIGGFAPPPPPVLTTAGFTATLLFSHHNPEAALQRLGYARQRARAPPLLA